MKVLLALLFLVASQAFAAHPYEAKFSVDWRLVSSSPKLEVWRKSAADRVSIVSATVLDPSEAHVKPSRVSLGKSETSSENIGVDSLKGFVASRNAKLAAVGIRAWTVKAAKRRPAALQFQGTYVGPSGAHHCFVEKQAAVGRLILQITATVKSESPCNWTELDAWIEQVRPSL